MLKNINLNFYSVTAEQKTSNLKLMDKLKTPYLLPDESIILHKTLQYDAASELQLFGEITYQNNAVKLLGNHYDQFEDKRNQFQCAGLFGKQKHIIGPFQSSLASL